MGFTINEKAFLLHYFRKRVKQESEDWPYFVPPYTEEFQARCPNLMVLVINKFINVLKLYYLILANHSPSLRRSQVSPRLKFWKWCKMFDKLSRNIPQLP
jgi:hypothetical protein